MSADVITRVCCRSWAVAALTMIACLLSGCVLAPRAAKDERAAMRTAGKPYATTFEKRDLPELPPAPSWRDVLQRALLANGELEAAYYDWAAAVYRIDQAGSYPN